MILKMAFRNIGRNRKRTVLSIAAIGISVSLIVIMMSYVEGIFGGAVNNYIRFQAGHLRIQHSGYTAKERLLPLDVSVENDKKIEKKLDEWMGVKSTSGRIKFGVILNVNDLNETCLGIAIDPAREQKFNQFSKYITDGKYIRSGTNDIMLGNRLANKLGLKVGDEIVILTRTVYDSIAFKTFKLSGIFELGIGRIDKSTFYIPLDMAQDLLDMEDTVTEIITILDTDMTLDDHVKEISAYLEKEVDENYGAISYSEGNDLLTMIETSKSSIGVLFFIVLILSGSTIMNTMIMSVFERTSEIGMMKSMGMKNLKIINLFILESTFMGVFAGIVGGVFGAAVSIYFTKTGINFGRFIENMDIPITNTVYFQFKMEYFTFALMFGIIVAVISALYPAFKATRMQPTEAMRAK